MCARYVKCTNRRYWLNERRTREYRVIISAVRLTTINKLKTDVGLCCVTKNLCLKTWRTMAAWEQWHFYEQNEIEISSKPVKWIIDSHFLDDNVITLRLAYDRFASLSTTERALVYDILRLKLTRHRNYWNRGVQILFGYSIPRKFSCNLRVTSRAIYYYHRRPLVCLEVRLDFSDPYDV